MTKTRDIVGKRKIFYIISSAIIILSVLWSIIFGVNVDIEFKGGTLISYSYSGDLDIQKFKDTAENFVNQEVTVKTGESFTDKIPYVELSFPSSEGLSSSVQSDLANELKKTYSDNKIEIRQSKDVKPANGKTFFQKCMVAVVVASILLIVYVAIRFKRIGGFSAGVMSIIALIHDCFIVYATFLLFNIPINANFMAVVLTVLGYSVNDTIVIYDRVRENKKLLGKGVNTAELMNTSINQSLVRSINTTISTVLVMTTVTVLSLIFNINSIFSFAFPLIIGMISGVYSSIFIAGPLWVDWQNFKQKRNKNKSRKRK